jgi:6-pyruvoyl-tetrahydropterin synthase
MIYHRTFNISIAHFNGADIYRALAQANECAEAGDYENAFVLLKDNVLPEIHGHNLVVEVKIGGLMRAGPFLIDDDLLRKEVEKWHNKNLSMFPNDFPGRATTEIIADKLCWSIYVLCSKKMSVAVTVHETPEIFACQEIALFPHDLFIQHDIS